MVQDTQAWHNPQQQQQQRVPQQPYQLLAQQQQPSHLQSSLQEQGQPAQQAQQQQQQQQVSAPLQFWPASVRKADSLPAAESQATQTAAAWCQQPQQQQQQHFSFASAARVASWVPPAAPQGPPAYTSAEPAARQGQLQAGAASGLLLQLMSGSISGSGLLAVVRRVLLLLCPNSWQWLALVAAAVVWGLKRKAAARAAAAAAAALRRRSSSTGAGMLE
jgi:hypothetical protein